MLQLKLLPDLFYGICISMLFGFNGDSIIGLGDIGVVGVIKVLLHPGLLLMGILRLIWFIGGLELRKDDLYDL
jgi:hypothetical protein